MNSEVNVIFRLPKDLKEKLKEEAKQRGLSLSAYLRVIIFKRET